MNYALFIFFMAFPVIGFSQANFQKGYIVTNTSDTIKGFVDFKERRTNPTSVVFSKTLNGSSQIFSVRDCAAYGINNAESFRRYVVNISLSEIDISKLSVGKDSTSKRDTVLLKVLQTGENLILFVYKDELKQRFYILDKGRDEPVELLRNLYLKASGGTAFVEDKLYGRQLLTLMKQLGVGTEADEQAVLRMRYDESSMRKVVALINKQQLTKSEHRYTRLFLGSGMAMTDVKYKGTHSLASSATESKTSFLPMFTAGLDLFIVNPAVKRLIFRTELSLLMSKNEVKNATEKHQFDQVNVSLVPQLIYHLYNGDQFKFFAGGGFGLNYASTTNNLATVQTSASPAVEIATLDLEKFYYSLQANAGIVFNKKIEIVLGYSPYTAITNYLMANIGKRQIRLGLNYLFGKQ